VKIYGKNWYYRVGAVLEMKESLAEYHLRAVASCLSLAGVNTFGSRDRRSSKCVLPADRQLQYGGRGPPPVRQLPADH